MFPTNPTLDFIFTLACSLVVTAITALSHSSFSLLSSRSSLLFISLALSLLLQDSSVHMLVCLYVVWASILSRLVFAGESYAGKYIPELAELIHDKNQDPSLYIDLKGILYSEIDIYSLYTSVCPDTSDDSDDKSTLVAIRRNSEMPVIVALVPKLVEHSEHLLVYALLDCLRTLDTEPALQLYDEYLDNTTEEYANIRKQERNLILFSYTAIISIATK
ncbi:Peptidase S10, serine carboxypeptidase [Dillenia turbinata]|uniref:Peptidase S10, serine carboxypeptidase n=1 Tax=Dillenia turbinata TaxID=194707 RepID=A0AAN8UNQ7_9MAGN